MTVCGIACAGDALTVWADDHMTNGRTGRAMAPGPKVAINTRACAVLTAAGWASLFLPAKAALQRGVSLDDMLPGIVAVIRLEAPHSAARQPPGACLGFGGNVALVAGWSDAWGRFVAYRLAAADFFEPVLVTFATSPAVEWQPGETAYGTAARQAALLAEPAEQVGRLTVVSATPKGMTILPPKEIAPLPVPELVAEDSSPPALAAGTSRGAGPARCGEAACRPEHHHEQIAA